MTIFVNQFAGEQPKVDPRLLPNDYAQQATQCQFEHGNLASLAQPRKLPDRVPVDTQTLYRYQQRYWFSWNKPVDAVPSPIANDPWHRVYFTGDGYPKVTHHQVFKGTRMPAVAYRLGVQAPEVAIVCTVSEPKLDDEPNDDERRYYTHTFVTEAGEEGPPGLASEAVIIHFPHHDETAVTLTLAPPNTNEANITRRRIYRSSTGGGVADYLLVAEVPIAQKTFVDKLFGEALGGALSTYDYDRPDPNLTGLVSLANGILAGFMGNTLCFSEPYLPYAWPVAYRRTTTHPIVALVATGNSVTALTQSGPWVFSGVTPDAMTGRNLAFNQPCVSAKSVVQLDGHIVYACPDGLMALAANGASLLTANILSRAQWQALQPDTVHGYAYEGRYLAFYGKASDKAILFDPQRGDLQRLKFTANCGVSNVRDDALYLHHHGEIWQWAGSETRFSHTWRSKVFHLPSGQYHCAHVRGKSLKDEQFTLRVDGKPVLTLAPGTIPGSAFVLPATRGDSWEFELSGRGEVTSVAITASMGELQALLNER